MGLDINFYKQSKADSRYETNVGYFRKVNFILNYFNVDENLARVDIPKDKFERFIEDLKIEIDRRNFNPLVKEPLNEKLRTKAVFFGGSLDYDDYYWHDIEYTYEWAREVVNDIDWEKDSFYVVAWW